jgi:hypothetical protein
VNAFTIFGRMSLDDRDYQSGLKRAEGETTKAAAKMTTDWKKVGESAQTLGRTLSVALTGAIVGVATAAIASTTQLGRYADKILDLAEQTGLSTDRLQAFERVAIEAGVQVNVLSDAAIRLTTQLNATGDESKTLTDALDTLGISTKDAEGNLRSMDDLLPEIMRGLAGVEDVTTRNALAADIFGRSSKDLIPVLALGADRIDELTDEAIRMGNVLSIDALRAANDLRIQQELLTDSLARTWREISVALIPVVSQLVAFIADRAVPAFRNFAGVIVGVIEWFQTLAGWQQSVLGGLTIALAAAGPILMGIGALIVQVPKLVAAFTTLRTVMLAFTGPVGLFMLAAGGVAFLVAKLVGRNSFETSVDTAVTKASELSQRLGDVNDKASLINSVKTLADYVGPEGSPGRIAFVNYANEIVATGDTAEEQFERIKLAAFEAANAVELNALRTRLGTLQSQLAFEQMASNTTATINSLTLSLEDNAAAHAQTLADMQTAADRGNREAVRMLEQQLQSIESMRNELEMALARAREASMSIGGEASARRVERIELEMASVNQQIRTLSGAAVAIGSSATSASRAVASTLTPALVATGQSAQETTNSLDTLTATYKQYQMSRLHGDRDAIIAAGVAADAARAEQAAAEAAHLRNLSDEYKAYQMGRVQSDRDARRQQLESAAAATAALLARQDAEAAALQQQMRLMQQGRLEASQSARQLAQNDLAFTLSMVERSYGPITSLNEAWRAFAQYGLTMTADMLTYLQQRYEVVELSAFEVAQGNLKLAASNVQVTETMQRLGQATQADVNDALIRQRDALVAVVAATTPFTAEWVNASNALADVNAKILTSSDLMVLAEQSSLRLVQAQYQLGQANREQVIASLQEVEAALLAAMAKTVEGSAAWYQYVQQITQVRGEIQNLGVAIFDLNNPLAGIAKFTVQVADSMGAAFNNIGQALYQLAVNFLDNTRSLQENMISVGEIAGTVAINLAVMLGQVIGGMEGVADGFWWTMAEMAAAVIQNVAVSVAAFVIQAGVAAAMASMPFNWWWLGAALAAVVAATAAVAAIRNLKPAGGGGGGPSMPSPTMPGVPSPTLPSPGTPPGAPGQPGEPPGVPGQPPGAPGQPGAPGARQREMNFGGVPQSVQLAVATPLLEASRLMLDAATMMQHTFGSMLPGSVGFGALPPFTDVLSRMTPVLERLLDEGVSINVGKQSPSVAAPPQLAFLR